MYSNTIYFDVHDQSLRNNSASLVEQIWFDVDMWALSEEWFVSTRTIEARRIFFFLNDAGGVEDDMQCSYKVWTQECQLEQAWSGPFNIKIDYSCQTASLVYSNTLYFDVQEPTSLIQFYFTGAAVFLWLLPVIDGAEADLEKPYIDRVFTALLVQLY